MKKNNKKTYLILVTFSICMLVSFTSCKKLIEISPSTSTILGSEVFKDSANLQATLSGLYGSLAVSSVTQSYRYTISTLCGFSADELQYVGSTYDPFINNGINVNDGNVADIWNASYATIYIANSIIEGVSTAPGISERFKSQATAEATFVRAFCYFYLTGLYGDVPLVLSTDVAKNQVLARTATATIYAQLATDMKFVQNTLPADYSISSNARTRANKWVATALLAKILLYQQDWPAAEAQAGAIIANTDLFNLPSDLTQVFSPTSKEAIWQFYNDITGYTAFAGAVLPNPVSRVPTYILTTQLVNAFETGDKRKDAWTNSLLYNGNTYYYPYKYKSILSGSNTEYYTIFRLADQYLVRAEARAHQDNIAGAQQDLSVVRNRAGLGNATAGDQASLLLAIEQERRVELNCEWGNRWLDLKRTGRVDAVIGALKPATWQPAAALFPIPSGQISLNANLKQNQGYN